jgi:hypothetical protein
MQPKAKVKSHLSYTLVIIDQFAMLLAEGGTQRARRVRPREHAVGTRGGEGLFNTSSLVLLTFNLAPAARQNFVSTAAIIEVQSSTEWAYTTTSSAYCESAIRRGGWWANAGRSTPKGGEDGPPPPRASISTPRGSAKRTNRAGGKGQPCLTPHEGRSTTCISPGISSVEENPEDMALRTVPSSVGKPKTRSAHVIFGNGNRKKQQIYRK